jgi:hypothetical protein
VLILVGLVWGFTEIKARAKGSTNGLVGAKPIAGLDLTQWSDRSLALAFLPVFRFDRRARWTPELVDDYVRRAYLLDPDAPPDSAAPRATPDDLMRHCAPQRADPCFKLTLRCPRADKDDGMPCTTQRTPGEAREPRQDGGLYVRVMHKGSTLKGEPDPFESFGPRDDRHPLTTMVQYWMFYDYDEWVSAVLGGRIVQRHEGDWEAITVGLADDRPLWVAFSQHCGGVWQPWGNRLSLMDTRTRASYAVDIDPKGPDARDGLRGGPQSWAEARMMLTHPTVEVAVGSQANYPPRLSSRAPDWATCAASFPREAAGLISYVSNIRDRTGSAITWLPKDVRLVNRTTAPMTFPGTWGEKDSMQFVTAYDDPNAKGGLGPATPSRQPLWLRPVNRIFCGGGWHGDQRRRDPKCG